MIGTSDLTNDLHARHTPDRSPLLYSLSKCVVAARAYKLRVVDGVYLDLNDAEGFAAACKQGRALGFDGKSLIHPKTVEAANEAFGPLEEEMEHARKVLAAWEAARSQGQGERVHGAGVGRGRGVWMSIHAHRPNLKCQNGFPFPLPKPTMTNRRGGGGRAAGGGAARGRGAADTGPAAEHRHATGGWVSGSI